jgi:hypothetical protein
MSRGFLPRNAMQKAFEDLPTTGTVGYANTVRPFPL